MERMGHDPENQIAARPPAPSTSDAIPRAAHRAGPRIREPEGRDAVGTAATHFAGIDVSKDTLDAGLLGPDGRTRGKDFANDARGHAALVAWAGPIAARSYWKSML